MFVIGTAGHVDHGKSTLVQALTGIDPDRLREEKVRGMTIDLGFAWLALPSGREVSIIDVPGHEKFIKNMLAGVGGIDLALLVVAADEAVMPQTKEHLAILDILQISRGIVVITKSDLVDSDWLDLVTAEIEETIKGSTLEGAPIRATSAHTGMGLIELTHDIDTMLASTESPGGTGRPRLPIDRSFVISGFGTVVTGTLTDGTLHLGQEVELVLTQKLARIRGIQTHRKSQDTASPGTRTAVNLTGVSHREIKRGDLLTSPGWIKPSTAIDVHIRLIQEAPRPLKHNATVSLYTGTNESLTRIRLLDRDQLLPGDSGWAQLRIQEPMAIVKGDFFVIRSSETTLGGGSVIEPHAKRHKRRHSPTLKHLAILQEGTGQEMIVQTLDVYGPLNLKTLAQRANMSVKDIGNDIHTMIEKNQAVVLGKTSLENSSMLLSAKSWDSIVKQTVETLEHYHSQFPLRTGAPREEIRGRLGLDDQASALAIERMTTDNHVIEEDSRLRLPQHRVSLDPKQQKLMEDYLHALESEPYAPPTTNHPDQDMLNLLSKEGKIVKVSENIVFAKRPYDTMVETVITHLKTTGKISVAQVRDMFNTSRKYALAFMENLDQQRITRRVGDDRFLR